MKVRFDGGSPLPIVTVSGTSGGGAWGLNNTIVYHTGGDGGLMRVAADGGAAEELTVIGDDTGESFHDDPDILPNGETALFHARSAEGGFVIDAVRLATGERLHLALPGSDAAYVEPGFIVYADGSGSLMAQPFDAGTLEVTGERFRIADGVQLRGDGQSEYGISRSGTLVYRAVAENQGGSRDLIIVARDGSEEIVGAAPSLRAPQFSPDGRYLAYDAQNEDGRDIWVWDLVRGAPQRVTFEGVDQFPTWRPDGSRLVFQRDDVGAVAKAPDGSGPEEQLTEVEGRSARYSSAGEGLLWTTNANPTDIWLTATDEGGETRPFIDTEFDENSPTVSPDGRWIAYMSDAAGSSDVYVEPFPDRGAIVKVSPFGGRDPVWGPDGSELFYLDTEKRTLTAVEVRAGERFDVGTYTDLFSRDSYSTWGGVTGYDVHPDGERFVFASGGGSRGARIIVTTNALARER